MFSQFLTDRIARLAPLPVFVFLFLLFAAPEASVQQQYRGKPVTKSGLLKAVASRQYSAGELVAAVRRKGVDFRLTPAIEQELNGANIQSQVLDAVRANYRAPAVSMPMNGNMTAANTARPAPPRTSFTGTPLTKDAIVTLLQNDVADTQVQRNVQARGVNFTMTPAVAREIQQAGGSNALVGVIAASNVSASNDAGEEAAEDAEDRYDEIIAQAQTNIGQIMQGQAPQQWRTLAAQTIESLKQAVRLDSERSEAYKMLAVLHIGTGKITEGEQYAQQTIDRGGSAIFFVIQLPFNGVGNPVPGVMFVGKNSFQFVAATGQNIIDTNFASITGAQANTTPFNYQQTQIYTFKVAVYNTTAGRGEFYFIPLLSGSQTQQESNVIARLLNKNVVSR